MDSCLPFHLFALCMQSFSFMVFYGHFRQFPIFNLWVNPLWFSTLQGGEDRGCCSVKQIALNTLATHVDFNVWGALKPQNLHF